eukprot:Gb_27161 [translate_table: standard]
MAYSHKFVFAKAEPTYLNVNLVYGPLGLKGKHRIQVVKELTSGGADYSFECVGNVGMIRTALESCCDGWGMAVVVGVPSGKMELSAHYGSLLSGRTLKGTLLGGWKPRSELPMLVEMYLKKANKAKMADGAPKFSLAS